MDYIKPFRNPQTSCHLQQEISQLGEALESRGKPLRIMEVCGSHTMAIHRFGIKGMLPAGVELISGPGCPVCVTDHGYIDAAIQLAEQGIIIATFGDMLRVPGSHHSLATARAAGAQIEICYSPFDALNLAQAEPQSQVVFLGIGFETTIAPICSMIREAGERGVGNISVLTAFKTVPPALEMLAKDPELAIDALICPPHVATIIGSDAFGFLVDEHLIPCVVAGFEPLDILYAIKALMAQMVKGDKVTPQGTVTVVPRD